VGSSPTSGALLACSSEDLNSRKKDKYNDNLQKSSQLQDNVVNDKKETIRELINSICKYQKNYVKILWVTYLEKSSKNYWDYLQIHHYRAKRDNIKELTKEGKIKTLIWLPGMGSNPITSVLMNRHVTFHVYMTGPLAPPLFV
jgi:hypothetical protein